MKFRLALVGLMLALVSMAAPRTASAQVGVLAGFNSAKINFDATGTPVTVKGDQRGGFVGGISIIPMPDVFTVELDALIAQKGTKFNFDGDIGKLKLLYLDVPVLARITVPSSGAAHVHLLAGPSFNFKLKESFDPEENNDKDQIKSFETALVIGGGVTVNGFRVDARYGFGLTNILTDDAGGGDVTGKNRVFSVLVGYGM